MSGMAEVLLLMVSACRQQEHRLITGAGMALQAWHGPVTGLERLRY